MTEKDFSNNWIARLTERGIKNFPSDFLSSLPTEEISLPSVNLVKGEELFGSYEITDSRGNSVFLADSLSKAKYILYSNRLRPHIVNIPSGDEQVNDVVKLYEKYLDSIVKEVESDYKKVFPKNKNFSFISNEIFNALNLKRY